MIVGAGRGLQGVAGPDQQPASDELAERVIDQIGGIPAWQGRTGLLEPRQEHVDF